MIPPLPRHFGTPTQVAHAAGRLNGESYTNSKQAFASSYAAGFRYFEMDIVQLADGNVITAHERFESRYGINDRRFWEVELADVKRYRDNYDFFTIDELLNELRERSDASIIF